MSSRTFNADYKRGIKKAVRTNVIKALEAAYEELRVLADYEGNNVDLKILTQAAVALRSVGVEV